MNTWRLLLTRPAEDCAALAQTLAAQGVASHCMPLLAIETLAETDEQRSTFADLQRYCAVIVISKPAARIGVQLLAQHGASLPCMPWFSVGAATAAVLAEHGLQVHYPDGGDDSEALLALPALQHAIAGTPEPCVLILRGEGGREFLAERLRDQGVTVDYLELYRRMLPAYSPGELSRCVRSERLNGLVVSSGQGFEHLRQLAGDDWAMLARLPLFVPSPRVADQARHAGAEIVVDCRGASAAALLAALEQFPAAAL
ncbi:Uroporphyrinogen-III synthase [Pseudomonas sp. 8Z]|uniref:uroporphyrinogen-III synthase n=1 Tax=Pseudomonas sp. 8Z TaxID=2653166 RepID=UPI0012EF1C7E|nr:uroporphyrinogen-III synthase [Pseudomonas sp. 8Z]VXC84867.1 Uroporphyrinogen-III synthase [Pseudomonas sp. 8Z]